MAFDITNPATYSEDFKSLLRQKGYAGRKDVPVEELEALYVDYSGKQEQDTKVATDLLSSVGSSYTPQVSAMTNQDTFQGDQSFDLMQTDNQAIRGPIGSTVQAVDEQEALKRQQAEQAAAQPDPNEAFRMVAQERLLPALDAIRQKRSQASSAKNTWERKMNLDQVDQLAAARINDLVASGVINSQEADLIRKRADESKGLTYEESLRGFIFDKMNPQQQQTSAATADPNVRANKWWELGQATAAQEKDPENPALRALVSQLTQDLSGGEDPNDAYKNLQNVNLALADVGKLEASNVYENTGLRSVFDGTLIEGKEAVQAYKQALVNNRISTTGFMQNRPETWSAVPSLQQFKEQGKSASDWANYVKNLPDGSVYIDHNTGSLGVKGAITKTTQPPQITDDNPFSRAVQAEEELETSMARSGKEKKLEQRRQEMASLEADAARMAENPTARGNILGDYYALSAGRMIGGAIPPVPSRESAKLKAERYATLKQEVEALERELGIVP